jgi:hypothetical protein
MFMHIKCFYKEIAKLLSVHTVAVYACNKCCRHLNKCAAADFCPEGVFRFENFNKISHRRTASVV